MLNSNYTFPMKSAPTHPSEVQRLIALKNLNILDTLPEQEFDDITFLASQICETPIALVSLVDESRQWFKSKQGLDANETPRDVAFCAHAILQDDLFIIPNAKEDVRFHDNPLVTGNPNVVFYAGAPLTSVEGYPIGTLCVIDSKPKKLREDQKRALKALSNQLSRLLELRTQLINKEIFIAELEKKNSTIQNLSEGVVVQDSESRIIDFNPSALEILSLTADQITGKTSMDPDWHAIKEDGSDFPGQEHPAVLALQTGQIQRDVVMGIRRPHTDLKWIQINATPLFLDNPSNPSHAIASFKNITLQKNTQKALEKNEQELNKILNGVSTMISYWTPDFKNIKSNTSFNSYFNNAKINIKNQSLQDIIGLPLFSKVSPYFAQVLKGETVQFEENFTNFNKDETHLLFNLLPDSDHNCIDGFFMIATDITEVKKMEKDRQVLAAKVVQSTKLSMLGEMAGGVAHELNNPLAIISTTASLLARQIDKGSLKPEDLNRNLEKINKTTERMAQIISHLRLFSKSGEDLTFEKTNIVALFSATLDLCKKRLLQNQVELKTDFQSDIYINSRPGEISQVLMSMLTNAIEAVEKLPMKWIQVNMSIIETGYVQISFMDSGTGIPSQIQEKMMDPFFTTKDVGGGPGLGLSISKGIIEAHNGRIYYDTTSPQTRFVIELPIIT